MLKNIIFFVTTFTKSLVFRKGNAINPRIFSVIYLSLVFFIKAFYSVS